MDGDSTRSETLGHPALEQDRPMSPGDRQISTSALFGPIVQPFAWHWNGDASRHANGESGRFCGTVQVSADTVTVPDMGVAHVIQIPDLQLESRMGDVSQDNVLNPALAPQQLEPAEHPAFQQAVNLEVARINHSPTDQDDENPVLAPLLTPVPESPASAQSNQHSGMHIGNGSSTKWTVPIQEGSEQAAISISMAPGESVVLNRTMSIRSPTDSDGPQLEQETGDPGVLGMNAKSWQEIAQEMGVDVEEEPEEPELDPMEARVLATEEGDDKEWLAFLTEQYCISVREDASRIDKALRQMQRHRKTGVSVDDNSLIWKLLPSPYFQVVLFFMFVIYGYLFVRDAIVLGWGDHEHASEYRFTVVELRDKSLAPTVANIGELGVNFYSCAHQPHDVAADGASLSLAFGRKVKMNEWYFDTAGDDPGLDPVGFEVELIGLSGTPTRLPAPNFHTSLAGAGRKAYDWHVDVPEERGRRVLLPLRPPLSFSLSQLAVYGFISLGNLLALLLCLRGMFLWARRTIAAALAAVALNSLGVFFAMLAIRRGRLALMWARTVAAALFLTPPVAYEAIELTLIPALLAAGVSYLALLTVDLATGRRGARALLELFELHELYGCLLAIAVALFLARRRRKELGRVKAAVQQHKTDFDVSWALELERLGGERWEMLERLRQLVRDIRRGQRHHLHRRPHQRLTLREKEKSAGLQSLWTAGKLRRAGSNTPSQRREEQGPPVTSLDQLYAQARCCQPLLREVAKRAALASNGQFPLTHLREKEREDPEDETYLRALAGEPQRGSLTEGGSRHTSLISSRTASLRSFGKAGNAAQGAGAEGGEGADMLARKWVRWEDAVDDPEQSSAIKWTALKPEARAVEKVLQRYRGDVSRLLDVCRETVVLDCLEDVVLCLHALKSDSRVAIERVKNSLDDKLSSEDSAGFRAVVINFRVVTPETVSVGCDGHICELLLLLKSFGNKLSEEGHDKYLNFRRHADSKEFLMRVTELGSCWRGLFRSRALNSTSGGVFASILGDGSFLRRGSVATRGSGPSRRGSQVSDGRRRRGSVASVESFDVHLTSQLTARRASAWSIGQSALGNRESLYRESVRRASATHVAAVHNAANSINNNSINNSIANSNNNNSIANGTPVRSESGGSGRHLWPRTLPRAPPAESETGAGGGEGVLQWEGWGLASLGGPEHGAAAAVSPRAAGSHRTLMERSRRQRSASPSARGAGGVTRSASPGPMRGRAGMRRSNSSKSTGAAGRPGGSQRWSPQEAAQGSLPAHGSGRLTRQGSTRRGMWWTVRGSSMDEEELGQEMPELVNLAGRPHGAWHRLLEQVYRDRTTRTGTGSRLDEKAKDLSLAVAHAERFSVFETSFPIAAAMSKRWFPRVVVLLGLLYLVAAIVGATRIYRIGRLSSTRVRFVPVRLREEGRDAGEARVGQIGLIEGECLLPLTQAEEAEAGQGWPRTYELEGESVHFNGFWFQRWEGDAGLDPMVMELQRWEDGEWVEAGDSSVTFSVSGHPETVREKGPRAGEGPGAEERAVLAVDLRASWFVWLQIFWADLVRGLTWVGLGWGAVKGKYRWGQPLLVAGLAVAAVFGVSGAIGHTVRGARWGGALHWAMAGVALGTAVGLGQRPQWFIEIVLATGFGAIVVYAADDALGEGGSAAWGGMERVSSFVLVVMGGCLWLLRWRSRREAEAQIQDDLRKYEEAWQKIIEDEDPIEQIENIVGTLPAKAPGAMQRFVPSKATQHRKVRRWIFSDGKKFKKKVNRAATLLRTASVSAQVRYRRHMRRQSLSQAPEKPSSRSSSGVSTISAADAVSRTRRQSSVSRSLLGRRTSSSGTTLSLSHVAAGRRLSLVKPPAPSPVRRLSAASPSLAPTALDTAPPPLGAAASDERADASALNDPDLAPPRTPEAGAAALCDEGAGNGENGGGSHAGRGGQRGRRNSSVRSEGKPRGSRRAAVFKEREGAEAVPAQLLAAAAEAASPNQQALFGRGGNGLFSRFTNHDADALPAEPPVESLDQLYAQAVGVQPLLKYKVQQWALVSNGMFFVKPDAAHAPSSTREGTPTPHTFQRWASVCNEPDADSRIKWGTLKSPERAIEKLIRSYEGKCAKLMDVCRQSIAFTSPQDLALCLEAIADDQQVSIVAVKNRLSHHYPAKTHSLGYRDVNINLRFTNPLAQKLCIHLHICEVQLLLVDFAKLKSALGHKRYVAFRNARGK